MLVKCWFCNNICKIRLIYRVNRCDVSCEYKKCKNDFSFSISKDGSDYLRFLVYNKEYTWCYIVIDYELKITMINFNERYFEIPSIDILDLMNLDSLFIYCKNLSLLT
jgi:hypothetical protein